MDRARIPRDLTDMLEPASTAVIMWDFQVGLGGNATSLDRIVATSEQLLEGADRAGVDVIWSRHTVPDLDQVSAGSIYRMMQKQRVSDPSELQPFMQEGSPEREFIPQLRPRPHDTIIDKSTPSFFVGTPLHLRLSALDIRSLVFCGVATDIGIDLSAKHASALGYFPVVVEDAVGSYSEERHEAALAAMRSWIPVTTTRFVLDTWADRA
ncbi:MAG TPA: isochorismatase family cysteine hydrolase [Acidimicrobiia bacterium]|nr:isochorismatase family cysteine hydrolase [Acidimicrobiia bacterium]